MFKRLTLSFLLLVSASSLALFEYQDYTSKTNFINTVKNQLSIQTAHAKSGRIDFAEFLDTENDPKDVFCRSHLPGTLSKKSCAAVCPGGASDCVKIYTFKEATYPELDDDLDCYGCDSFSSCYDQGLIYDFPDCIACEMDPLKDCVKAVAIPIAGFAVPLPKDSDGTQCWDCVAVPDTCNKHFPGSTLKTACTTACKNKKDHKCVWVGNNPDNGFGCYQCKHFPPPVSCYDFGAIYQTECNTCPPNLPSCEQTFWTVPGGGLGPVVKDSKGTICYDCYPNPKTCEEQGLKTACPANQICDPKAAPNGANCCECRDKPKDCSFWGMKPAPGQCSDDEIKIEKQFTGIDGSGKEIDLECYQCVDDPCHPDLNAWDCAECEKKGGKCTPRTRVRGAPQCYSCVMPPKKPKSCQDLERSDNCANVECPPGEHCEIVDSGNGLQCAQCMFNDSQPPPEDNCVEHETHKMASCAPCYNASMTCDQIKVSDNPEKFCAKCLPPIDQRCDEGLLDGACASPWCVENQRCFTVGQYCHTCECEEGKYRDITCDNKCSDSQICQGIEGCGEYIKDEAIEAIDPEGKFCGPDITGILHESLTRIFDRMKDIPDNEKGAIDGTMFLDKNGWAIDLRAQPLSTKNDTPVCPSKPCKASDGQRSVMLCGKCVMEHIGNDILFGFIANQVDVPWHIQLAGAHYAEVVGNSTKDGWGPLDPLSSQGAYMMGNKMSEAMEDGKTKFDNLCEILNSTTLKTGFLTGTSAFELMQDEQPFLRECEQCPYTEVKVMKDFSQGDWILDDGSHAHYLDEKPPYEPCCYNCVDKPKTCEEEGFVESCQAPQECMPVSTLGGNTCCECYYPETPPPPACEDSLEGACRPNPCPEGKVCQQIGENCHHCNPKRISTGCQTDAECDNEQFCDGEEFCDGGVCRAGDAPCHGENCYEEDDVCGECSTDQECNDSVWCNGEETCDNHACLGGTPPCKFLQNCDEVNKKCNNTQLLQGCKDGYSPGYCGNKCLEENCDTYYPNGPGMGNLVCHKCSSSTQQPSRCENVPGSTEDSSCNGQCSSDKCKGTKVYDIDGSVLVTCYKCEDRPTTGSQTGGSQTAFGQDIGADNKVPKDDLGYTAGVDYKFNDDFRLDARVQYNNPDDDKPIESNDVMLSGNDYYVGCPEGSQKGECPLGGMMCGFGSVCVSFDGPCHRCMSIETEGFCDAPSTPGQCPSSGKCDTGAFCQNIGPYCKICTSDASPYWCPQGTTWGSCEDVCGSKPCMTDENYPSCKACGWMADPEKPTGTIGSEFDIKPSVQYQYDDTPKTTPTTGTNGTGKDGIRYETPSFGGLTTNTNYGNTAPKTDQPSRCENVPGSTEDSTCHGQCTPEKCKGTKVYDIDGSVLVTCYKCEDTQVSINPCAGLDCDDHDDCTTDSCSNGECINAEIITGDCAKEGCKDLDPPQMSHSQCSSTCEYPADNCQIQDYAPNGERCYTCRAKGQCVNDDDCDDHDDCTEDACGSDGQCTWARIDDFEKCGCTTDEQCDDGDKCTDNSCFKEVGTCQTMVLNKPGCGGDYNLGCSDELGYGWNPNGCGDSCPPENCKMMSISGLNGTGMCYKCESKISTGCTSDSQCSGGDDCHEAKCSGGVCSLVPIDDPAHCDDDKSNPCPATYSPGLCSSSCPPGRCETIDGSSIGGQGELVCSRCNDGSFQEDDDIIGSIPGGGGGITTGGGGGVSVQNPCSGDTVPGGFCGFFCEGPGEGVCVKNGTAQFNGDVIDCFSCVKQLPSCGDLGQVCSCNNCDLTKQICAPGYILKNPTNPSDLFLCKRCINKAGLTETGYQILIRETIFVRYVLGGNTGFGFNGSSVMALADSAKSKALGLIGGQTISAKKLAETLKSGLEKGSKYGDNCFDDFEPAQRSQTPPSQNEGNSSSSSGSSSKDGYGNDGSQNLEPTAPQIACGEFDGKKALAFYDAQGAPIMKVFKEDLKDNPNAIEDALALAQQSTQQFLALKEGGIKGILQRAAQTGVKTVLGKIKDKFSGGDPRSVTPNDPLYTEEAKGKKKKLLGILGGSESSAPIRIGGPGMRMGSKDMNAPSGSSHKEEIEVNDQWGIQRVGFKPQDDSDSAWNVFDGSKKNVIVAVIDSGLDMTHPDAPEFIWQNSAEIEGNGIDDDGNGFVDDINGWNFLDDNPLLTDYKGHGTFVAGIIAAKRNNGIGIAGINPGAIIMPLKVANEDGETTSFAISRAIYYAVNNGARIINISLGAVGNSQMEYMALKYAHDMGVFVVAASGNVNEDIGDHGPASSGHVFAVGAIDISGDRSTISNHGANISLVAPGEQIISILSSDAAEQYKPSIREFGYYPQSGTSFSTPMVAATASLLLAQNPNLTSNEIEDILLRSADDMDEPGWDGMTGYGLLNATRALKHQQADSVTIKITRLEEAYDGKKFTGINVYATVRGEFKSFVVELGKGHRAKKFETVAGPFKSQANHSWVAFLDRKEYLRGSNDWIVRITATDNKGKQVSGQTLLELK